MKKAPFKNTQTHVDRPEAGTMPGSHVLVHGLDGIGTAKVAVLLVHVVGTRSRVISQPDAKVLDLEGSLLEDLQNRNNKFCVARLVKAHSACLLRAARDTFVHVRG